MTPLSSPTPVVLRKLRVGFWEFKLAPSHSCAGTVLCASSSAPCPTPGSLAPPLTWRDGLPAATLCGPRTKGGGVATALPEEPAGWKRKNQKRKQTSVRVKSRITEAKGIKAVYLLVPQEEHLQRRGVPPPSPSLSSSKHLNMHI